MCPICQARDPAPGSRCCPTCPPRLRGQLLALPGLIATLTNPDVVRDDRQGTRATLRDGHLVREPGWPADPATVLPAGMVNAPRSGPRVAGSAVPPVPANLDHADLTREARYGTLAVACRTPWPQDQIGHLAVASELDFWARDVAEARGMGEHPPSPTVALLAPWLAERAGWVCEHHGAVDEMAEAVRRMHGALLAACGLTEPRPEPRPGVRCPACDSAALARHPDSQLTRCHRCGETMDDDGYAAWCRALAEESDAA